MSDELDAKLDAHYSPPIIAKAHKIYRDGLVARDPERSEVWWCRGSGGGSYRLTVVQLAPEEGEEQELPYVVCSCPNGTKRGGQPSCYHSAAVIIALSQEPL